MKFLMREKLSPHKYKTPEGYLICQDAILARTGKQTYRKNELFADSEDDDTEIEVDRPEKEVFSDETLASFENKPVTVEHPDEDVNSENWKSYQVGYARDIRRGKTDDGEDVMIGNLVIQDADTIEEILNGEHCELSCGYDCDVKDIDGNYCQTHIRGNHIALCEKGRAGIAKIVDSVKDKESANVRRYIELIEGRLAKKEGYELKPNMLLIGHNKINFPMSTLAYQRLVELGYGDGEIKDSVKDSIMYKGYELEDLVVLHDEDNFGNKIAICKNGVIVSSAKTIEEAKQKIDRGLVNDSVKDVASYTIPAGTTLYFMNSNDFGYGNYDLVSGEKPFTFDKKMFFASSKELYEYVGETLSKKYGAHPKSKWTIMSLSELRNFRDSVRDAKHRFIITTDIGMEIEIYANSEQEARQIFEKDYSRVEGEHRNEYIRQHINKIVMKDSIKDYGANPQQIKVGSKVRINVSEQRFSKPVGIVKAIRGDVAEVEYTTDRGITRKDYYYIDNSDLTKISDSVKDWQELNINNYSYPQFREIFTFDGDLDFNWNDVYSRISDVKGYTSEDAEKLTNRLFTQYKGGEKLIKALYEALKKGVKDSINDEDNIRYKEYVIYKWSDNDYRAIKNGRSSFDFSGKTVEEVKKKIDRVNDSVKDAEYKKGDLHIGQKIKYNQRITPILDLEWDDQYGYDVLIAKENGEKIWIGTNFKLVDSAKDVAGPTYIYKGATVYEPGLSFGRPPKLTVLGWNSDKSMLKVRNEGGREYWTKLGNIAGWKFIFKDTKDALGHYFRLDKKKNDYDEFVVKEYVNGKFREEGSYYTDDWEDAVGTIKNIARSLKMNIRQQGSSFIADSTKSYSTVINGKTYIVEATSVADAYKKFKSINDNNRKVLFTGRELNGLNKEDANKKLKNLVNNLRKEGYDGFYYHPSDSSRPWLRGGYLQRIDLLIDEFNKSYSGESQVILENDIYGKKYIAFYSSHKLGL